MKRFLATFWLFLLFPWVGSAQESRSAADSQNYKTFLEQARRETEKTLRKRQGLVIWIDLKTHGFELFGEETLKDEKFPPGSLMKLITAETLVEKGEVWNYRCVGHEKINGKKYQCWTYRGHGSVDLPRALAYSCNLFFATLGNRMGAEAVLKALKSYSFSETPSLEKLRQAELPKFAIGDSPLFKVSPLEMAVFWQTYLTKMGDPAFAGIRQGLLRSVTEGTASRLKVKGMTFLGKTGTSDSMGKSYKTDGWFLGAAPAESPQAAIVVFLREAHGFEEPVALAEKFFSLAGNLELVQ